MEIHRTLKKKLSEWNRVLKITRKPDREEFTMSAKVTGVGILIVGTIGFLLYMAANLIQMFMRGGL